MNATESSALDEDAQSDVDESVALLHMALELDPRSVGRARIAVAQRLGRHQLRALCDDAVQVVSELVTNAIQHGTGHTVTLTLREADRTLHIDVAGSSDGCPALRAAPAGAEDGRGLWIVDRLATRWGSRSEEDGVHTWCMLVLPLQAVA